MLLSIRNNYKKFVTECQFEFARSSGPGGQNVNKVSSKAILRWHPESSQVVTEDEKERIALKLSTRITKDGFLIVMSDVYRSQDRNKHECLKRLMVWIEQALFEPKKRKKTTPSARQNAKRLDSKSKHALKKSNRKAVSDQD